MKVDGTSPVPAPILSSRSARLMGSLGLFAVVLLVSVPAYTGVRPQGLAIAYRFGLPVLWGVLGLIASRIQRFKPGLTTLLSLFGVSFGFGLAYLVGDQPIARLGLSVATPQGAAVAKLSEAIPMCAAIFLATLLAGRGLDLLSLRPGRLGLGLGLGLLAALPLLAFLLLVPGTGAKELLARPATTVLAWLPWIAIFSLANGFMEELWYRGIWFGAFRELIGTSAALHVTSLAFSFMHVIVYWSQPAALIVLWPVFLYVGYACVLIVRKTGSLWGAVLAHFLVDLMFVLAAFGSG